MKRGKGSFYLIVFFLLLSGAASWNLYYRGYVSADTVDIKTVFPLEFNGWKGEEMRVSEYDMALLETRNLFLRRYKNTEGSEVFLYVVYSQSNRKVSHPPEICYKGSGVTIVDSTNEQLSLSGNRNLMTRRLVVEGYNDQQLVLYWFKVGDTFTSNYWKQQMLIALKSFLNEPASSALIRISTKIKGQSTAQNLQTLKNFAQEISPIILQQIP